MHSATDAQRETYPTSTSVSATTSIPNPPSWPTSPTASAWMTSPLSPEICAPVSRDVSGLSEEASPQVLEFHLPRISEIIIGLLQDLKLKQAECKQLLLVQRANGTASTTSVSAGQASSVAVGLHAGDTGPSSSASSVNGVPTGSASSTPSNTPGVGSIPGPISARLPPPTITRAHDAVPPRAEGNTPPVAEAEEEQEFVSAPGQSTVLATATEQASRTLLTLSPQWVSHACP
ncbi:hypothetical protein CF326_g7006 [Tilletia indica]|nr:hypothetical protein CF326_g7006 [Tilletia indica]